jgi:dGTPase
VQFVNKIARAIAHSLFLNEDLVEAIALGSNLGRPPFGVSGEAALSRLLQRHGAGVYSTGAHAVRVLDELENAGAGLNLTLQVLDGVLTCGDLPGQPRLEPAEEGDFNALDETVRLCMRQEQADDEIVPASLEGCIVRLADVLARDARLLDDAATAGVFERSDIPGVVESLLGTDHRTIISMAVMDIITASHQKDTVGFTDEVFFAINEMRTFLAERVYQWPEWARECERLGRVYETLFEAMLQDLQSGEEDRGIFTDWVDLLPENYRSDTPFGRIAADYLASLSDRQLIDLFAERFAPRTLGYRMP